MKITQYGEVIITEDDISVTGFNVEGGTPDGFEIWALRWAVQRIAEARRCQNIKALIDDLKLVEVSGVYEIS